MQKITLYLLVVFTQIAFGQTKISETEKLVATCKIWGFLKYYHPKVANGEMNWDEQLMTLLPKIDKAQHREEVSLILENWIDELGSVKKTAPIVVPKDVAIFDKNFDLSWFDNKLFSKKLSKKLKFIEENRFQSDKEFDNSFDSFAKIKNYFDLKYSNRNSRLLMLFVYWNAIEYYFPYKYVMDQKWDLSLQQIIPAITAATNEIDFYNEMQKLTTKLNDSHVEFVRYPTLSASKAFTYFPATGKIIDEKLIVTEILGDSLAEADTIKIGDVITKINGKTIKQLISENRELICASNEAKYLDKIIAPILKSDSENVKVEFLKEGKYVTKSMIWGDRHESHRNEYKKGALKKKEKFKLLEKNIGYVDMGVIKNRHIPAMIEALKETKAIVFDMRNYPNNTWKLISDFLNAEEKEFCLYTMPYMNYPGKYVWTNGRKCGLENKNNYKGKAIVLLNEDSISQSEWTAMCFQAAGNTTIIGSQTAGTDGNVFEIDFKGFHTRYTGIGVYYPDKRPTQRIGIVPDIEIKPTIKGIQEGRDEVLERALAFIETGK